ncbi:helix-turn-helix domain-containing protein [Pseudomonas fulva]|uniref:Helix-turn-helix domain-containing protein n=1 Tax=Pseudomonas fulva TaxID=47880 RepID=A0A7S9LKR6_9PSED|nr:helix-turn-helix domain-containing protein [Pseudomonas fulva]QPH45535.1 helix-turn-helix domain-containing protein [Pseudomonas fulva]QPH50620.1 helix-turn-helix domain-containing protein [Pseudomonas fulva]
MSDIRSKMADEVNCYTAEDISELAKVNLDTLAYWRKHGKGPKAIRFGSAYLYPKIAVMEFINNLMDTDQDSFIRQCI